MSLPAGGTEEETEEEKESDRVRDRDGRRGNGELYRFYLRREGCLIKSYLSSVIISF